MHINATGENPTYSEKKNTYPQLCCRPTGAWLAALNNLKSFVIRRRNLIVRACGASAWCVCECVRVCGACASVCERAVRMGVCASVRCECVRCVCECVRACGKRAVRVRVCASVRCVCECVCASVRCVCECVRAGAVCVRVCASVRCD